MTTQLIEAARLALEALETLMLERGSIYDKAITALRAALEQPAQDESKREWVGLTDEERRQILSGWEWDCMKAVEAKLKEKNHG